MQGGQENWAIADRSSCETPIVVYPPVTSYGTEAEASGISERSDNPDLEERQCCQPPPPVYTCGTVTITEWTTTTTTQLETILDPTTTTRTVNVPTTIPETVVVPTTIPTTDTVSITDTVTYTSWQTTTSVTTDTITTSYPITVTSDNTIISTRTTTEIETTVRTLTTSFPVTETVTGPGETVTQPPETITQPPATITAPGEVITLPGEVITLPGETVTTTITQDGETITTTVVLPPATITQPGEVITVTPIFDVTVCPLPTGRSVPFDPRSNLTFGCAPGYVCNPPKPAGCNLWPEPPADDFVCEPEHCILSPPFSNTTWPEGKSSYYPPSYGYFNLNPHAFGLSYDIFEFQIIEKVEDGITTTITTGNWESQASLSELPLPTTTTSYYAEPYKRHVVAKRQDEGEDDEEDEDDGPDTIPNICFAPCNDAYKVALQVGKSDDLCEDGSSFQTAITICTRCSEANQDQVKETVREHLDQEFYQFLEFCGGRDSEPTETSATAPETQVTSAPDVSTTTQGDVNTSDTFTPIEPTTTVTVETSITEEPTTLPTSSVPEETKTSIETTIVDTTTVSESTGTETEETTVATESVETTVDSSTSATETPVEPTTTETETTVVVSGEPTEEPTTGDETAEPTATTPVESETPGTPEEPEPSFSTSGTHIIPVIPTGTLPGGVPGEPSTIPTAAAIANGVPLHLGAFLPALAMFFA